MSLEVATVVEDAVEYSFAMEYHGPPITRELPRAVPINVDRIPVASVVSPLPFSDSLSLPVVQPISAADIIGKKLAKDLKLSSSSAELLTVSPTSVIAFESQNNEVSEGSYSKELGLGTETSVSPSSVNNASAESETEIRNSNDICALSGELSSDFECCNRDDALNGVNERGYSSISHDEFVGGVGSSGALESSDSFEKSREFSGSLRKSRLSSAYKESLDFNESNRTDWESNESVLSVDYLSSRVSSRKFGDANQDSGGDVRRAPVVTFCDIESDDENVNEDYGRSEPEVVRMKKEPAAKVRKGACYRCLKGSRFTEKEVCMVCDAKYCTNCVLRAMGSMPEGRKCVTCIGYPISESKRVSLGKCSRMLKRLLNDLEVKQIMKAEKFCEVNQLPPEYICVNGRPLYHDELVMLQSSPNPPKKLKPGNYWYDKVSGLWGKEGQKPLQIISPHLNVGGPIKPDASNGNTQVYINGREITKVELRMLKLAGVQCAGNPHFWVNEDGSYQEEGQKNTKGYIWGKAGTKLLCAVLSLPVPSKSSNPCGEQVSSSISRSMPDYLEHRSIQKLLLIGYSGSGTSTIFKQARILYKDIPFSEDEREQITLVIQSHVYNYIGILLEGRERFEEESLNEMRQNQSCDGHVDGNGEETPYSICPRLKAFSDWLLKIMASGTLEAIFPAASREYAPLVEELCSSAAFQATYKRRHELESLPSISNYFLEQAVEILKPDYRPSDVDILYAEHVTSSNGLACVEFSFPEPVYDGDADSGDMHDSLLRYQLIRLQAKGFGENCKWLEMLEDVRIVIFCVSLSDYDQFALDGDGNRVNKMMLSKKFFENMVTHPTFDQMEFLLLLNKFDSFEEKIEQVPLTKCEWFDDFHPVISRNRSNSNSANHPTLGQLGFHYVAVKFKRLYAALTGRKLYASAVKALEPTSVDAALKYAREVLNWDEERPNVSLSEYSIYSTEASSFSH
ncbi:extra-large guanine nucleotide-binding protein 1 isoform X2 [Salvia miltiorrhiza]|uniref:extra-large guanine nucleotide-binding protein 1 isoform X2 n=1 Tax=Salvia miltiorrhiza TaxID=226208 RepID=UPI0025AB605F|nr:extra-large guanine nucleotide-binding protein 1 isoform X2 [Salvia miltiorrhiza]